MKGSVVLYNPVSDFDTMPLGLLAIGSALDPGRFDVTILDGRLVNGSIDRVIEACNGATCLGITVLTGRPIRDALRVSRAVKQHNPDIPVVWGGWHPSLFPSETLAEHSVDYVVQGQGEIAFSKLVDALAAGNRPTDIGGLHWLEDGKHRSGPPATMTDMNELPRHRYGLIDVEAYFERKGNRQLDYITSTGCFFRCAFCADPFVFGRRWSGLEPERIVDELMSLYDRYRFDEVAFQDETFFTYRNRVSDMAQGLLDAGSRFTWTGTMRADQGTRMSDEEWDLAARSGMRWLLIGVESGSPEMLERMKKDITLDQVFHCAEQAVKYDQSVVFPFIVGFPGEPADSVEASIDVAQRLRAMSTRFDTPFFYFKPYPGSSMVFDAVRGGYRLPSGLDEWCDFDYVDGSAGPWVSDDVYAYMERFKFYLKAGWGEQHGLKRVVGPVARWRCKHRRFGLPLEKWVRNAVGSFELSR